MADIQVTVEDAQPINVTVSEAQPIDVKIADVVEVYTGGAVSSVNAKTGTIVLGTNDIADTTTKRYTNDTDITRLANTSGVNNGDQDLTGIATNAGAISSHVDNTSNPHSVTKAQVGLANVDNTTDLLKPISTATQSALDDKATTASLTTHTSDLANPHAVTKAQVGLASVPNTDFTSAVAANTAKVGITPTQASNITANNAKISYTDAAKVAGIATGATANDTDANLKNRANHTGTQTASTISDFSATVASNITGKQDTLISATNIKTINGATILGSGDLVVSGGGGGSGTVTSVSSANADATVATGTTTPVITVVSAPKLTTARNINGVAFDGTANITVADSTKVPTTRTVNTKALSADITLNQDEVLDGTTNKQYSQTEKTRLAAITDADYLNSNTTKTQVGLGSVPNTDFTAAVALNTAKNTYPGADATKLAGIASDATANSADATLLARANHTGTQLASTISDFATTVTNNTAVAANTAKVSYTDSAKVAGIEAGADVTDTANITAAGALMDSEVTNLTQVKAFSSADYAAALGVNDNYVTDAEKTVVGNTSGMNTGDQTYSTLGVTGSPTSSNYLRGDNTWDTPADTTYAEITSAEITTGTATTTRAISGRRSEEIVTKARTGLVPKDTLVYNVKDHGAIGNGVADDTAALQAAIDAQPVSGGVIFLPNGTYKITSALNLRSNITIYGEGTQATKIKQTSTTANGLRGIDTHYFKIRDLSLIGPGSGTGTGILITKSVDPDIHYHDYDNIEVNDWGVHGIDIANLIVSTLHRVLVVNNSQIGIYIHGTGAIPGTSVNFDGCYAILNDIGYQIEVMSYVVFTGSAADKNRIGYKLKDIYGSTLTSAGAELNTTDFDIDGGRAISIVGCFSYSNKLKVVNAYNLVQDLTLIGIVQSLAEVTSTHFIYIDGATKPVIFNCFGTTPNYIPGGVSLQTLYGDVDTSGVLTAANANVTGNLNTGGLYASGNGQIDGSVGISGIVTARENVDIDGEGAQRSLTIKDANAVDYLKMYHSDGLYAQIEGTKGFVLSAPNGTTVANSLRVQETTTWNSATLTHDGTNALLSATAGNIGVDSKKIVNLATPTAAQDASTKKYVDDSIGALTYAIPYPMAASTSATSTTWATAWSSTTIFDTAAYSNIKSVKLIVALQQENFGTYNIEVRLTGSNGLGIAGTEMSATLAQWETSRLTSPDIKANLITGQEQYYLQFRVASGGSAGSPIAMLLVTV